MTSLPYLQPPAAVLTIGKPIDLFVWRHRLAIEILDNLCIEYFLAPSEAYNLLEAPDCDLNYTHKYVKYLLQFIFLLDARSLAEVLIGELYTLQSDIRKSLIRENII